MLACVLLACWAMVAQAQDDMHGRLEMVAKPGVDGVQLRFAPDSYATWMEIVRTGCTIERTTFTQGGKLLPQGEKPLETLNASPLKPAARPDWEAAFSDDYVAVAAQSLYGESFEVRQSGVAGYVQGYQEQQDRYGFGMMAADQSVQAAQLMGLYWKDGGVENNEAYAYKIYPSAATRFPVDTAFVYVVVGEEMALPKIPYLNVSFATSEAQLTWEKPTIPAYVSYVLERSTDGKDFQAINPVPIQATQRSIRDLEQHYADSLANPEATYYYRVAGKDVFGDLGPYSNVVSGRGMSAPLDDNPFFDAAQELQPGQVQLQWKFPEDYNPRLQGFIMERASHYEGPYRPISELLPPDSRTFYDENAVETSYYQVTAIDKEGRSYPSGRTFVLLSDEEPPAPPTGLKGSITEEGLMTLEWAANTEEDLLGYRVFFSNAKDDEPARLTRYYLRDTLFTDTVNMDVLNEEIYYRVVALDLRQNVSAFSEAIQLKKPDRIPPAAPRMLDFHSDKEAIQLTWSASASADVVSYSLKRRPFGTETWETIYETPHDGSLEYQYADTQTQEGQVYEYTAWAWDDAGLPSFSAPLRVKAQTDYFRPAVEKLRVEADRREKHVRLSWKYPDSPQLQGFMIYKGRGEALPSEYLLVTKADALGNSPARSGNSSAFRFLDADVGMNTDYQYRVRAIFANGVKSALSPVLVVGY